MIIGDESKSIASVVHIDQSTKLAEFGLKIWNWKQLQIQTQYFQKPGCLHWRGKRPCNKGFKCYFFVFCQESILKKYFPVKDKQLAPFLIIFSHLVSPSSVQVSLNCSGRDQAPTVERLWIYVSQGKVTRMTGGNFWQPCIVKYSWWDEPRTNLALVSYLVTTKTLRKVADQCRAVEEEVIFDVSHILAIKYCISMT